MRKVFICSRYRTDEGAGFTVENNVRIAIQACAIAIQQGYAPYAPHLYLPQCLYHLDEDMPICERLYRHVWREFLSTCDEVWQWGKTVTEEMREVLDYSKEVGIPIRVLDNSGIPEHAWNDRELYKEYFYGKRKI